MDGHGLAGPPGGVAEHVVFQLLQNEVLIKRKSNSHGSGASGFAAFN